MSHYDISYSNISKDQQDAKALNDIREYLGNAKYKLISEATQKYSMDQIDMFLGLAGVRGFPVFAFMRAHYSIKDYDRWYSSLPE
jgi:hypothetical protein